MILLQNLCTSFWQSCKRSAAFILCLLLCVSTWPWSPPKYTCKYTKANTSSYPAHTNINRLQGKDGVAGTAHTGNEEWVIYIVLRLPQPLRPRPGHQSPTVSQSVLQPHDKYAVQQHGSSSGYHVMNGLNKQERCLIKESGDVKAPVHTKTPE